MEELTPLKVRAKNYPVMMAVLLATVAIGASLPAPANLLRDVYRQYRMAVESLTGGRPVDEAVYRAFASEAFTLIALSVPLVGPLFAAHTSLLTGLTLRAIAYAEGRDLAALLASFLIAPSTWIRLLAYSVVLTESMLLGYALLRRRGVALEMTAALLLLAASLLLLAVTLEFRLAAGQTP